MAGFGSLDADAIGSGTAFALSSDVRLIRCASHSRYHGYPRLLGVVSWQGCRLQFTDAICHRCAMRATDEATGFVSTAPRRLGGDRAAALFVGLPLTVALVLAAAPLSEPPARFSPSALPARMITTAPSPAPTAAFPGTIVVPRVGAAGRVPLAGRGATIARARPPLAARSMVVVARGVERVEIQSP